MNNTRPNRVLVIEDEAHIADGLKLNLELQGYEVAIAPDGVSGLQQWKSWQPDLIVLDIMLPCIDGISVLKNIRLEDERLPILILSAKSDTEDKIKGFASGVDDYLSKPFNLEEFLLRVERLLTRSAWYRQHQNARYPENASGSSPYIFGENRIHFDTGKAHCQCGEVDLTEQEMKLLKLFITNRGKPLSRKAMLEVGWGYARNTQTRTIDNFIVRFRKYFEKDPKAPVFFKSCRSVGYIFDHE
ncbi:MAG: response regulator transcription factor [Desulfobacterales bacterium]|nr:response regulator transcription factor [Desulfobacterales bacterium]MDD4072462.1 response regulator transcription factor [Desulfobacterales bacterium]MDD4393160.1 response regulator transcription factor [Desulfobacterales bacterium]